MNQINRRRRQTAEPFDCLRPVIRFFGIITAVVICGVGVDVFVHGHTSGIFILLGSFLVLLFEIKWVVTLFLHLLFASDGSYSECVQCWSVCKIAGGWRLSPFYAIFGAALMLWPNNLWLSHVAGILLIILASLRLCTLCRLSNNLKDEGLLPHCEFEKVDGFADVADEILQEGCQSLEDEEPIDEIC